MKKVKLTLLIIVLCVGFIKAQAPLVFNYQGVARNNIGSPIANSNIHIKTLILSGDINGQIVFSETHNVITSSSGLFTLKIGLGNNISGNISNIKWGEADHYLRIEADFSGGNNFQFLGTNQLLSVPYALFAKNTQLDPGDGIKIQGSTIVNTGDLDPLNEIQNLKIDGNMLSISNGNSVELPVTINDLWVKDQNLVTTDMKVKIGNESLNIDNQSQLNIVTSDDNLITFKNNSSNNFYIKNHYATAIGDGDTCLLVTSDEAIKRNLPFDNLKNYQKYGLKIYPNGEIATPGLTFGPYRSGNPNELHSVKMYFGDGGYTTGAGSDGWPNFNINASDNHVVFYSQWGTTFYGGIILKSPGGKCFNISIDDLGNFVKRETTCP